MEKFQIYLAGKSYGLSFEEQNQWREKIKKLLENHESNTYKIKIINPNDYFNYYENLHKTQKQIK